jgi:hypothetical protein
MRGHATTCLGVALCLVEPGTGGAETIRVPQDYATINAAISAASPGDTVLVAAGTYSDFETRNTPTGPVSAVAFLKGDVILLSESGPESTTLRLDATVGFPTVVSAGYQQGTSKVAGFTITSSLPGIGGASFVWNELGVVEDCIFRDMGTGQSGEFGLGGSNGDLAVRNCQFFNIHGGTAAGGSNADFLFEDCHFENCSSGAMQVTEGLETQPTTLQLRSSTFLANDGSACFARCEDVIVEGCRFADNREQGEGSSGGAVQLALFNLNGVGRISGNTFVRNSVTDNGIGGAVRASGLTIEVSGNTFHGNSQEWSFSGGATFVLQGGTVTFSNNVVSSSSGAEAGRLLGGSLTTSCNVFWDNPEGEADGFVLDPTDVIADPLYCAPEVDDFTVSGESPCLPENSNGCGLIGAWGAGCGIVSVVEESWGRIKARFSDGE